MRDPRGCWRRVAEPELTRCFPRGRSSADPDRATRLPFAFDSGHARTMRTSCASRDSDPRDNTDLALVNSGYSKTKLVAAARVCHFRSLFPNQTRRLCRSVTHAGPMGRPRHLIESGKYRQTGIFVWVFSVCDALQRYFGKSAESSGSGTPAAIPNRAFVVRPKRRFANWQSGAGDRNRTK